MNASVIVLDSSDSEDEKKPPGSNKKSSKALRTSNNAARNVFPATSVVNHTTISPRATTVNAATAINTTTPTLNKVSVKSINIPSGITVTRHSSVLSTKPKTTTVSTPQQRTTTTMSSTSLNNITGNRPSLRITTIKSTDTTGPSAVTPKAPPLLAKYTTTTNNQGGVKVQQQTQQSKQLQWIAKKIKPQLQQQQQQQMPKLQPQQKQLQQQPQMPKLQPQQRQPQPQNQQRFPKIQQDQQKPLQKQVQVQSGATKRIGTPPVLSGNPPKLIKLQVEDTARLANRPSNVTNTSLGAALKSCVNKSLPVSSKSCVSNPSSTVAVNRKLISYPILKPPETTRTSPAATSTSVVPIRLTQSQINSTATTATKAMPSIVAIGTNGSTAKPKPTTAPALLPIISSVHTITASATPPLRLLASPPHSSAGLKEPPLLHLNLPSDTTVTAQTKISPTIQKTQQQQHQPTKQLRFNNNSSGGISTTGSNTVITRNVIQPSLIVSPKCPAPGVVGASNKPTSSTMNIKMTTISNNNGITNNKSNNNNVIQRTVSSPVTNIISTNNSNNSNSSTKPTPTINPVKRITPTTLLQKTDEAWQHRRINSPFSNTSKSETENSAKAKSKVANQQSVSILTNNKIQMNAATTKTTANLISPPSTVSTSVTSIPSPAATKKDVPKGSTKSDLNGSSATKSTTVSIDLTESPLDKDNKVAVVDVGNNKEEDKDELVAPLEPEYEELLKECRKADPTADMERLIKVKLLKYYHGVHITFVRSRGFRKTVRKVIEAIRLEPDLVYLHVKTIVDELKVRRKAKVVEVIDEDTTPSTTTANGNNTQAKMTMELDNTPNTANIVEKPSESAKPPPSTIDEGVVSISATGNKHTDQQIRKLSRALHIVKKRIETLETTEVDWNDDDSSYMQMERFKKRACQLYEKICDLTGEKKSALSVVRKPIQFNATEYSQFNKTLQAFINRTHEFPDYYDVFHMLEHCNQAYAFGLASFEMKRIAQDAFTKVGKVLQKRRKADLYETVTHFAGNTKDPAAEDLDLAAKLNENKKNQKKISDILEKYAREQDLTIEEQREARLKERLQAEANSNAAVSPSPSSSSATTISEKIKQSRDGHESGDSEDDDEDDEEEDRLEDIDVDNLVNGQISDAESDAETEIKIEESNEVIVLEKDVDANSKCDDEVVSLNDSLDEFEKLLDAKSQALKTKALQADWNGVSLNAQRSSNNAMKETININNNNNTKRIKTGLTPTTTTAASSMTTVDSVSYNTITKLIPNGKVNPQSPDMTGHTAIKSVDIETVNLQSSPETHGVQTLKIMSVSSLNANCVDQPLQEFLNLHTTNKTPSRDPSPFAEIVISDEDT